MQHDRQVHLTAIQRFLVALTIKRCGRITTPKPFSGSGVRASKAKLAAIERHQAVLPGRLACARNNIEADSKIFLAQIAEVDEMKALMRKKIAAGAYDTTDPEYQSLKKIATSSKPDFNTFLKELTALEQQLATEEQRARTYASQARGHVRQATGKRNAIIASGLSAGLKSAAATSRAQYNTHARANGTPPLLSPAEKQALQAAHARALANANRTPLTSSGSSGSGLVLTATSEDCSDPDNFNMSCTENRARRARESDEHLEMLAEQARIRQAREAAAAEERRRQYRAADKDHNDCIPPVVSPNCSVVAN